MRTASRLEMQAQSITQPGLRPAEVSKHAVHFYTDESFLLDTLTKFIGTALGAGDAAIVIASAQHRRALESQLRSRGLDVAVAAEQGRYVFADAAETLSRIMVNDWPDATLFHEVIGNVLVRAKGAAFGEEPRVAAFGEMVALLWANGNTGAAIRLEQLWNELAKEMSFSLLCGYPLTAIQREHDGERFLKICAEHSHIIPVQSDSAPTNEDDGIRAVREFEAQEQALRTIASERQHLAETLAREVEDMRRLHELATQLTTLDVEQIMLEVLSAVAEVQRADMGLLSVRDAERNTLRIGASIGFSTELLQTIENVPAGSGACGACMDRRERVILANVFTDPLFADYRDLAKKAGFSAVHSTPLLDGSGNLIGVISIHFRQPYRPTQREIHLTDLYAQLAVSALENARLYHQAEQEIEKRSQAFRELQQTQAALMQSERYAEAGRLAASIAHEINNPLEAITNLFYLLRTHPSLTGTARDYADRCEQELSRVAHIVKQTLAFYRDTKKQGRVQVSEVVRNALALQAKMIERTGVNVHTGFETEGCVFGHEGEIRQIVLNLIGNALQATQRGERIEVRVRASADWRDLGRRGVRITVADNGCGIRAENRSKLFEPFFSTKDEKGTGLGLWVSKGIVLKYHGSIRLRSRTGHHSGTCFSVFLPAAEERANAERNTQAAA